MTYRFVCHACGLGVEADFPMADTAGRRAATCPGCSGPLVRDYSTVQFRFRVGWRNHTHYDVIPDSVRGMGPHSKEARDYAERTWPKASGP